ncbi:MAG: 30S ribosomal protein S20 [Bacteroidetes bacterium]|nr:30S ribosomal protein S20 [Bacteroidota bacterium]
MAHHASAKKRIRQIAARRLRNRYYGKTTRNAVRNLRAATTKSEAQKLFNGVASMLDKLAKRGVIHKNKASNNKSKLSKYIKHLA